MEELISMVSNVGFPILVTFYLLTRFESKMDTLTTIISDLNSTITNLKNDSK